MAASSTSFSTTSSNWGNSKTQISHSKSFNLKFQSKPIHFRSKTKISCALHTPSLLNYPKQASCKKSFFTKEENTTTITTTATTATTSGSPSKWNLLQKAASMALDTIESALISHDLKHPLPKTTDPRVQIAGNFAPVPENPVKHSLSVSGTIPDCINGVYLRNGANPQFEPTAGHHFFDGDGMVHAISIENGGASYACRFTETERLVQEQSLGKNVFPKAIGELHGHSGIARLMLFYARGMFGILNPNHGIGVANAGLVYFNNRLLAMSEDDLPYQVRITSNGDLETIGRYNFDDQLKSTMIAHPKLDSATGELFALSYDVVKKPYLKYFKFSANGEKSKDVEIPLDVPTMMHDFAITKNFVVIPDQQVVFKLQEMIKGGSPVIYDKTKTSRFGILRKDATDASDIIWVESAETFCFHLWNSWEEPETDEVVVIGSCMTPADSIFNECDETLTSVLSEIRLNLKTGKSTRRPILSASDQVNLEAGMVNKHKLGRETQFAYLAIAEPWPKVSGFAKVNLSTGETEKYFYGNNRFGGEPYFLPKDPNSEHEDEGYILTFVHDENTWKSELQIVNAMTMKLEASVNLPSRVPYGFHGTFVNSKDLINQA